MMNNEVDIYNIDSWRHHCKICGIPYTHDINTPFYCRHDLCRASDIVDFFISEGEFDKLCSLLQLIMGSFLPEWMLTYRINEISPVDKPNINLELISRCIRIIYDYHARPHDQNQSLLAYEFYKAFNMARPGIIRAFMVTLNIDYLIKLNQNKLNWSISSINSSGSKASRVRACSRMSIFAGLIFTVKCDRMPPCPLCTEDMLSYADMKKSVAEFLNRIVVVLGIYKVRDREYANNFIKKDPLRIIAKCMWKRRFIE